MKSRSHRLPPSAPPDDWVDGSWTVDCSCGVTFDDGEEMVSCDECGVWVHTRCSRFVKGEASFACHNCKNNASRANSSKRSSSVSACAAADTEETEVAQLLIELPTKADSCPPPSSIPGPPYRPPFRLWAEVPLEDRVHVQGVPGGDQALFQGISSSVFTSELWRCTGYVPKKFNFQYREFPCWDEDGGESTASRGADVLFSLSKEIVPSCALVTAFGRKQDSEKVLLGSRLRSWGNKDRNKLRAFGSHSSKRRKEELREGKDRSGKKKARSNAHRVAAEFKKRGLFPVAETNKAEFCNDGVTQITESDVPSMKREEGESLLKIGDRTERLESESKQKESVVVKSSKGGLPNEEPRMKSSLEVYVKFETDDGTAVISSKLDSSVEPHKGNSASCKEFAEKEDLGEPVHGLKEPKDENHHKEDPNEGSCPVVIPSENSRTIIDDNVPGTSQPPDSNGSLPLCSKLDKLHVRTDVGDAIDVKGDELLSPSISDGNLHCMNDLPNLQQKTASHNTLEIFNEHEPATCLPSDEQKSTSGDKDVQSSQDHYMAAVEVAVRDTKQHAQLLEESAESSTVMGVPTEALEGLKTVNEKAGHMNLNRAAPAIHKPPASSSHKSNATASSSSGKTIHVSKHKLKVSTSTTGKKDNDPSAEENMQQGSRHSGKSHPKSSDHLGSKSTQTTKSSNVPVPKHPTSGSKEQLLGPSSKAAASNAEASGSGETTQSRSQNASSQKHEKSNHTIPHLPSKLLNSAMATRPPGSANAASTLSDEELALLLHQELNSSPRVPRVPRMRQATGVQLTSQTGPSMLSKRSSNSGGKDQGFRRKNKEETSRDGSRNSHDSADEMKRSGKAMVSPDRKYREPAFTTTDGSAKKGSQNRSPDNASSTKQSIPTASTEGDNDWQPSTEASDQSVMPTRSLPRDGPDANSSPAPRTLPALVDDILSKRKCSTYEELCDAVSPYWYNLRKPNGERYAYSSHAHAVLDCLRNRSEWAHLIDRGPKTNSSKRRRKNDLDPPAAEEAENEAPKDKTSSRGAEERNGDCHREDFPKGKRKARKRRQPESQPPTVGESRKRKRTASQGSSVVSNDDDDRSINDDGVASEDESRGAVDRASGAETSSTSPGDSD